MSATPFEEMARRAPHAPGVYLMRDAAGKILYVGKAKDLRARLRNYAGGTDTRGMVPFLLSRLREVEWILTATEKEALILENNLIKEHRPRYNVDFRDDKAYFHLRMDTAAPFPRWQLVRRPRNDGARYFGPYPSGGAARETLRFLQTVFPLRTCRDAELRSRRRPCLEHQIGRCPAPCVRLVDAENYQRSVREALTFMEGKAGEVLRNLEHRMARAAAELQFEAAAALRDRIAAIRTTLEKQQAALLAAGDQDVFGSCREDELTQLCLLRVRAGKLVGMQTFPLIRLELPATEIMTAALMQFYDAGHEIPGEILLPAAGEDRRVLAEWLGEKRGGDVRILIPKRGRGRDLVAMADRNAAAALHLARQRVGPAAGLACLAAALGLRKPPERMECFDISNIGGQHAVGSMVAFRGGAPWPGGYRRFRIRTVAGADDYGMMYEVLSRRFARQEELPDLLVVDGGKGQLSVALSVLKDLRISTVEAIALAKERDSTRGRGWRKDSRTAAGAASETPPAGATAVPGLAFPSRDVLGVAADSEAVTAEDGKECAGWGKIGDRVFLPGRKDPLNLSRWPAALFLLQQLRDEAHRFAVAYHRQVRERADFSSVLDDIPGLGPAKRQALLQGLGDPGRIRAATVADLQRLPGIGGKLAAKIRACLDAREAADRP